MLTGMDVLLARLVVVTVMVRVEALPSLVLTTVVTLPFWVVVVVKFLPGAVVVVRSVTFCVLTESLVEVNVVKLPF